MSIIPHLAASDFPDGTRVTFDQIDGGSLRRSISVGTVIGRTVDGRVLVMVDGTMAKEAILPRGLRRTFPV